MAREVGHKYNRRLDFNYYLTNKNKIQKMESQRPSEWNLLMDKIQRLKQEYPYESIINI